MLTKPKRNALRFYDSLNSQPTFETRAIFFCFPVELKILLSSIIVLFFTNEWDSFCCCCQSDFIKTREEGKQTSHSAKCFANCSEEEPNKRERAIWVWENFTSAFVWEVAFNKKITERRKKNGIYRVKYEQTNVFSEAGDLKSLSWPTEKNSARIEKQKARFWLWLWRHRNSI